MVENERHVKKWVALGLSFLNVSMALIILALPLTLALTGTLKIKDPMMKGLFFMLPMVLVAWKFYKVSGQSAKEIVNNELSTDKSTYEINTQTAAIDSTDERIRNAFNSAREKLGMQLTPIALMRSTEDNFNAFAVSSRKDNVIVVFDGLTNNVSDEKLQAVIGHELGHIKNKDSLQKTILFAVQYYIPHAAVWSDRLITFLHDAFTRANVWWLTLLSTMMVLAFRVMVGFVQLSLWVNNFINAYAFKQSEHIADQIGVNASSKEDMIDVLKMIEELENRSEQKPSALYLLLAEHPKTSDRINFIQNLK